ncbi:hypothetical protein FH972_012334 [Carpinus fangiana]|uniref:Bifunctional inhibitor/plant lipid transfer protein/seed storage helical domain-containing protein n=1 Tax=Carpinus fangiana TaxID=176857 RepID=A0A5N6R3R3_9ROSI|nr:hypothetical protein FH972_012334 [Carpinus fangiana]
MLLLATVVLTMWSEVRMGSAEEISAAQCKEERRIGINACKAVLYGKLPSPACCERVRVTHIECVCADVTPKLAALIDVNRAVRLTEGCGRRVPHHFKCGSNRQPVTSPRNPGLAWPFSLPICISCLALAPSLPPGWRPTARGLATTPRPRRRPLNMPMRSTSHHAANQLSASLCLAPHTHLAEKPISAISSSCTVENTDPCCNDSRGYSRLRPRRPVLLPSISFARFAADLGPPTNGFTDHQ